MKAYYVILGMIVWNRLLHTAERIWSMDDREFGNARQYMNAEEKRLAEEIRNMKRRPGNL